MPQLFDPVVGMFSKTAHEEVFFNAACDWYLDEYELAGLLVGLAVYNSVVLEVRLPVVAYKKLLVHNGDSFEPSLSDLQELDGDLAKGLKQLLAFDGDVENIFCRTFEDDDPAGLPGATIELMPNGASTNVTSENREDYVNALCDYRLREAVRTQFDRFAKGFWRVLGQSSIERVVDCVEIKFQTPHAIDAMLSPKLRLHDGVEVPNSLVDFHTGRRGRRIKGHGTGRRGAFRLGGAPGRVRLRGVRRSCWWC